MKKNLLQNFKIIILAVILFVGVNQALSWYAPTQLPPLGNTLSPIDTSSTSQVKGGTNNFGSMLHINGLLSSNLLKVNTFAGNGDKYVCVNNSGQLYVCGAPVVIIAPTVTTAIPSSISPTSAVGGGTISSDGGGTITVSGLVWSTSPNPTTALSTKTTNGWATGGPWTSNMTGLSPNTFYYVRSYATNTAGTAYGNETTFTTAKNITIPTLTTAAATNITQNTATSGGTITSNGNDLVTVSGIVWSTSPNPTTALSTKTTDGWQIGGPWTSSMTGLTASTTYYVRAYATNSAGTGYGSNVAFTTLSTPVVTIGSQVWMQNNLNIGTKLVHASQVPSNNGVVEKFCNYNDEAQCTIYGGLYTWNEFMNYSNTEGAQGICPAGFHIPTDADWTTLANYLGGASVAGGKMKEVGTVHWRSPNTGATNSSGFNAIAGGPILYGGIDNAEWFASSSPYGGGAWFLGRNLFYNSTAFNQSSSTKDDLYAYFVRCIKN